MLTAERAIDYDSMRAAKVTEQLSRHAAAAEL